MRLSYKSRLVLELIFAAGVDTLGFCLCPMRGLKHGGGWDDDSQFYRHLERMRENGLITWEEDQKRSSWVLKVTALGKDKATDDFEPIKEWNSEWDGNWRVMAFDLPQSARSPRRELDMWLRKRRFGRLQGSVWISSRFPDSWKRQIEAIKVKPKDISFLEGVSFGRSTNRDFVNEAWDFSEINRRYKDSIAFLKKKSSAKLPEWIAEETAIWKRAFELDPFLPNVLLPKNYLGKEAHAKRKSAYAKQLGSFVQ